MIWDTKYTPQVPDIICPVCNKTLNRDEWDDFGMHLHCTEYYISGRYARDMGDMEKAGKRYEGYVEYWKNNIAI